MTQQQIEAWLTESGFDRRLKNRYKRDFIDLKILEISPDVFGIRIMIYAPDCDSFLNIIVPISEIDMVDNREVQVLP